MAAPYYTFTPPLTITQKMHAHIFPVLMLEPQAPANHRNAHVTATVQEPLARPRQNSRMMLHQPSGGSRGVAADIEIQAQEILLMREQLNNLIAEHTGKSPEVVAKDTDRDFWMSPDSALEYGLIDKIQKSRVEPGKEKD